MHRLGWQKGQVVTTTVTTQDSPFGPIWVGFRCRHCGRVTGKHRIAYSVTTPRPSRSTLAYPSSPCEVRPPADSVFR